MNSLFSLRLGVAELLALAASDVYPGILLVDFVVTEFGFYYDFLTDLPIDDYGLILLEEKMRGLAKAAKKVRLVEMMRENAASFFLHHGQSIVARRVLASHDNIVSIVQIDTFSDFCEGKYLVNPFILDTSETGAFKLLNVEKASYYIEGEGSLSALRIHGTAFFDSFALKKHLKILKNLQKTNHLKIGEKLSLFIDASELSPHGWYWLKEGARLRHTLLNVLAQEYERHGFERVVGPPLQEVDSQDDDTREEDRLLNCCYQDVDLGLPTHFSHSHTKLFALTRHKTPACYFEYGHIPNLQREFHLGGLHDTRFVMADQGHIFCEVEQVVKEVISCLQFIDKIVKMFNFEGYWCLQVDEPKAAALSLRYQKAIASIDEAFTVCGYSYSESLKDAVSLHQYRGPVLEMRLTDALGREWKGPFIAFDFVSADYLKRCSQNSKSGTLTVLAVSVFRSLERMIAILLEHDEKVLTSYTETHSKVIRE